MNRKEMRRQNDEAQDIVSAVFHEIDVSLEWLNRRVTELHDTVMSSRNSEPPTDDFQRRDQ